MTNKKGVLVLTLSVFALTGCVSTTQESTKQSQPMQSVKNALSNSICSNAWFAQVDKFIQSGDGQGHGPDIGSDEWKSVVEFALGLRGNSNTPARNTEQWCQYIQQQIKERTSQ